MVDAVQESSAEITVHYGTEPDDVLHCALLPRDKHLSLVQHDTETHLLPGELKELGELVPLVTNFFAGI